MASRVNFKTILAKYQNVNKGNVRLTQSTLFLSKPINPTTTVYNFDVLESQTQTLLGDEIRLNLNDEYTITQIGFYLQAKILVGRELQDTGARVLLTDTLIGNDIIQAVKLQPFYDGAFQIAVNNIIYLDKYDTKKSNITPITQANVGGGVAAAGGYTASFESDDFSRHGLFPTEPMVVLSGAKKNNLQLTLPRAIDVANFACSDGQGIPYTLQVDRVVVKFLGLNAQNGASFQK
jgi:hypothetical protein